MPRFKDQANVTAVSHLKANADWHGIQAGEDTQVSIYNPPPGWVVLDTDVHVESDNNGSRSVSVLAGGLNLLSESLIESTYKTAIDVAASYKDKSIKANLQNEETERKHELQKYKTNKNTIVAKVSASAHGSFADRKRGWEEISVTARLVYIGAPDSASLISELEAAYKIDFHKNIHNAAHRDP